MARTAADAFSGTRGLHATPTGAIHFAKEGRRRRRNASRRDREPPCSACATTGPYGGYGWYGSAEARAHVVPLTRGLSSPVPRIPERSLRFPTAVPPADPPPLDSAPRVRGSDHQRTPDSAALCTRACWWGVANRCDIIRLRGVRRCRPIRGADGSSVPFVRSPPRSRSTPTDGPPRWRPSRILRSPARVPGHCGSSPA